MNIVEQILYGRQTAKRLEYEKTYDVGTLYSFLYHDKRRWGKFHKLTYHNFGFTVTFETLDGYRSFREKEMFCLYKCGIWERILYYFGHTEN